MVDFVKQKAKCLSQADLSKKGSVDEHIIGLVQYINGLDNYFTTSSCSGRICVFSEDSDRKKKSGKWLFISHDKIELQSVLLSLNVSEGDAVFKFEPFVLHVQCKTLEDAQSMLRIALESGYKNSGIVVGKKSRFILYLEYLVEIANKKMDENLTKIERFFKNVKTLKETLENRSSRKGKEKREHYSSTTQQKSHPQSVQLVMGEREHIEQDDIVDCLSDFYEHHVS